MSRSSASLGARFVTCFSSPADMSRLSAACISSPDPIRLLSNMLRPSPGGIRSTRTLAFFAQYSSASGA